MLGPDQTKANSQHGMFPLKLVVSRGNTLLFHETEVAFICLIFQGVGFHYCMHGTQSTCGPQDNQSLSNNLDSSAVK